MRGARRVDAGVGSVHSEGRPFQIQRTELAQDALTAQSRGFDRWVPIGQAVSLDRIGDGWDLVRAFGRQSISA